MNYRNINIANYVNDGFAKVDGWVLDQVPQVLDILGSVPFNMKGGVAEIGVHHGRMFILMNLITSPDDKSYAIDIFNDQHLNIDSSGKGWLQKFTDNLEKYDLHKGSNTLIIQGDSTDPSLNLREIIGYGKLRAISIDGGHTVEHTLNDLNLAIDLVSNTGVVIVDDILNQGWLGVIEGVCRFMMLSPTLIPFAIGGNKLYMCKLSYRQNYFNLMNDSPLKTKVVKFFGYDVVKM